MQAFDVSDERLPTTRMRALPPPLPRSVSRRDAIATVYGVLGGALMIASFVMGFFGVARSGIEHAGLAVVVARTIIALGALLVGDSLLRLAGKIALNKDGT
jgi:Flp pilus assembly pilin Flp